MPVVLGVLLVTSSFALGYEYGNETQRQYVDEEAADALVAWLYEYRTGEEVTTDFQTFGSIVAHSGMQFGEPYFTNLGRIDPETYAKLDDADTGDSYNVNYLVVNVGSIDQPVMRGPPTWTNFEPLGRHTDAIATERALSKVYASGSFRVYRPGEVAGATNASANETAPARVNDTVNASVNESENASGAATTTAPAAESASRHESKASVATGPPRPDTSRSSRRNAAG